MYIVSINTGNTSKSYRYEKAKHWDVVSWAIPVIDMLQSSSAEVVSYQVKSLFESENCPENYIRIIPELYDVTHQMDDASPQNIAHLKEAGARCIATHTELIDQIVGKIIS